MDTFEARDQIHCLGSNTENGFHYASNGNINVQIDYFTILTKTAKLDLLKSCANAKTIKRYVGSECYRHVGKYVNSCKICKIPKLWIMDSHFRIVIFLQTESQTVLVSMISTSLLRMDETMFLRSLF